MKFLDRNVRDSALYLMTAVLCSFCFLIGAGEMSEASTLPFVPWLIGCAGPLLFIFAYSRFVFYKSDANNPPKWFAVLHIVLAISAPCLFMFLSPFRQNPVRNLDFSVPGFLAVLAVLITFSVSAFFLLFKNKSTLATVASVLFWPYWIFLALLCENRWFEGSLVQAGSYWFFFMAPVFCAFAAGTLASRPAVAHMAALASILSAPWLYRTLINGTGYDNLWLMFNLAEVDHPMWIFLTIFFVGLIMLTVITAAIRLLPSSWQIRKHPLRDRTWPALVICLVLLSLWFSQSVMPYRIPGAVDYSRFPMLQILHIEKRGLQFHEVCANVWGYREEVRGAYFFEDNRRLFQYGFELKNSSGDPPQGLVERIRNFLKVSNSGERRRDEVKPIRSWNADAWYVSAPGAGLHIYGTPNNSAPPQEIVDLFYELDKLPRSSERKSEMRDVCLGFCYDPISAMGWLYSNHRCGNDGHGVVCR